jgi:UDP-N-acetylmuramyl tripeptide synthase
MKLVGRKSTALPGYVAEKIGQTPLDQLLKKRRYAKTILVTGTNGKTTTTMLIAKLLQADSYEVVNNSSGSNLSRGVLTAVMSDRRQGDKTVLLLEVDEASMPAVCRATKPDIILVLNIFRDQLDRYGEVDYTRRLIEKALEFAPNAELILCADDPHVARLGSNSKRSHYFGLNSANIKALDNDHAVDVPISPKTGAPINYSRRYFGHVGIYTAVDGSFARPEPDVVITNVAQSASGQVIKLLINKKNSLTIHSRLFGLYNAYNIAAALAVADSLDLDLSSASKTIESSASAFGRQEELSIYGKNCKFMLIKNPTGFNQVIQAFFQKPVSSAVVIVINDNFADGRDISWLWDAAVEDMKVAGKVVVSGTRAYDMALRLEYAGIDCEVEVDPMEAIKTACFSGCEDVLVLPTYTALLKIRKQLDLKLEHAS